MNAVRGETLFGAHRLVPAYAALLAVEAERGSLFALIERAAEGRAELADISAVLWHCCEPKPGGRQAFEAEIARLGLAQATAAFRAVLEGALAGA